MQSFELPEAPKITKEKPVDKRMYTVVPIRAVNDRRIRPAAMRALLAVCSFANRAGLCWPGHENVGKMLGVTRQAAGRQVKKLVEMGYLKKVKNHTHGKTAQILRVIYDDSISTTDHMDRVKFEDLPPTLQAWQTSKAVEVLNQDKEPINIVALTAEKNERSYLSVDDVMLMWKKACSAAGIIRIVTSEDRQAVVSMCAAGLNRESFERVLHQVFVDWQQYRREPPHRLAWFAARLASA
jgi:DNA-binding Lrp family transcriptional regulator